MAKIRGIHVFPQLVAEGVSWEYYGFDLESILGDCIKNNLGFLRMGACVPEYLGQEVIILDNSGKRSGRVDFFVDYDDFLALVEIKKGELDVEALKQLKSYLNGKVSVVDLPKKKKAMRGVLVGTSIDPALLVELRKEEKEDIAVVIIRRFKSKGQLYDLVESPLPFKIRDYSKYKIEGDDAVYTKTRLVLGCIENYLRRYPRVSFDSLCKRVEIKRFTPPVLLDKSSLSGHKYEWAYENKSFSLGGVSFVVRVWWDISEESSYKKIAEALECNVTKVKS